MCLIAGSVYSQNSTNVVEFSNMKRENYPYVKQQFANINLNESATVTFSMRMYGDMFNGQYATVEICGRKFELNPAHPSQTVTFRVYDYSYDSIKIMLRNPSGTGTAVSLQILETDNGIIGRNNILWAD